MHAYKHTNPQALRSLRTFNNTLVAFLGDNGGPAQSPYDNSPLRKQALHKHLPFKCLPFKCLKAADERRPIDTPDTPAVRWSPLHL